MNSSGLGCLLGIVGGALLDVSIVAGEMHDFIGRFGSFKVGFISIICCFYV